MSEEWSSEDFMKLRRMKEEFSKPESVLDVALGRTAAWRELAQEEAARGRSSLHLHAGYERALWAVLDCLVSDEVVGPPDVARAIRITRRVLGLGDNCDKTD